jgi:hypothetical protein
MKSKAGLVHGTLRAIPVRFGGPQHPKTDSERWNLPVLALLLL